MLASILQQHVQTQVDELIRIAATRLKKTLQLPTVGFRRSGRTAGSAHLHKNHINFNPILLTEYPENYRTDVVPHEVAHIVVFQVFGRVRPHGQEWQMVMREIFGCEPKTTHSMHSKTLAQKTFTYRCDCGPVELTIRRHNRVQRGQQQYQCRTCRQLLTPAAE